MMLFGSSEQAKGYALAQGEINAANALAATRSFQAALAANRMAARNQALASDRGKFGTSHRVQPSQAGYALSGRADPPDG